jgi:hypothetical protein
MNQRSEFPAAVQALVGPVLLAKGLVLDEIEDGPGDAGRYLSVVYYRGVDCRIQVYWSSREGETNCMIAPLSAPNEFGLRSPSKLWQFLGRFAERSDLPLPELARAARVEFERHETPLHWVKSLVENHFDAARASILDVSGPPSPQPLAGQATEQADGEQ